MKKLFLNLKRANILTKTSQLFAISLFVFLSSIHNNVWAQTSGPIEITGTVTEKTGDPLYGVSVFLKGTTKGTTTDLDGKFKISVADEKSVIKFSYISFVDQEVVVGSKQAVNVVLQEKDNTLDEVIVVGYGAQRKRDISGAIESITAKSIEDRNPISVFDAMQGQMAGVEVTTGSGAPGEGAAVRIRGISTFGEGAEPLYIVDGVVTNDIMMVNTSDIESIEVLKDAASAAIYGSQSANGVILITTKKGEINNPKLDIRYSKSFSNLIRKMPAANSDERRLYDRERRRFTPPKGGLLPTDTLAFFNNSDVDLQDLLFGTAVHDEIYLNASGASDVFSYYVGFGYLSDKGMVDNTGWDRLTASFKSEYKASKMVSLNSKVELAYTNKKGLSEQDVLNSLLERVPYWAIYTPDGEFTPNILSRPNPLARAHTDVNKNQKYKATFYQDLRLQFNKKLRATFSIQGSFLADRTKEFRTKPQLTVSAVQIGRDYTQIDYNWLNENYIHYSDTFNKDHNVTVMAGMSVQEWDREQTRLSGSNYVSDEIYTVNAASDFNDQNTFGKIFDAAMVSFYTRADYNYKSRYIFSATIRYDGSSRFGKDSKWGAFPAVSAAWRFSDESFASIAKPFLTDGKLRASWARVGNNRIGYYDSWQTYNPEPIYGDDRGIAASNLGMPSLTWESTTQINLGLDLLFQEGKWSATADIYQKDTKDLLANVEVPKETGFKTVRQNIGEMETKGIEFSLRYNILNSKKIDWSVNFNISRERTMITRLASGVPFYKGASDALFIEEGTRLGTFRGFERLGIFSYDESNAFTDNGQRLTPVFDEGVFKNAYLLNGQAYTGNINQKYASDGSLLGGGDVDYTDVNGDFIIDVTNDRKTIGNAQADFYGGFGTSFRYDRVSLTVGFVFSYGGDIYNHAEAKRNALAFDGATPTPDAIHNMWLYPGDDALYPKPMNRAHNSLAANSFFIEDGSYFKLSNVKIDYKIPPKILKKVFVKSASIYGYGKNLLTFTDYKGYDPELTVSGGDALTMGIDTNRYPRKREFGFGLNVSF